MSDSSEVDEMDEMDEGDERDERVTWHKADRRKWKGMGLESSEDESEGESEDAPSVTPSVTPPVALTVAPSVAPSAKVLGKRKLVQMPLFPPSVAPTVTPPTVASASPPTIASTSIASTSPPTIASTSTIARKAKTRAWPKTGAYKNAEKLVDLFVRMKGWTLTPGVGGSKKGGQKADPAKHWPPVYKMPTFGRMWDNMKSGVNPLAAEDAMAVTTALYERLEAALEALAVEALAVEALTSSSAMEKGKACIDELVGCCVAARAANRQAAKFAEKRQDSTFDLPSNDELYKALSGNVAVLDVLDAEKRGFEKQSLLTWTGLVHKVVVMQRMPVATDGQVGQRMHSMRATGTITESLKPQAMAVLDAFAKKKTNGLTESLRRELADWLDSAVKVATNGKAKAKVRNDARDPTTRKKRKTPQTCGCGKHANNNVCPEVPLNRRTRGCRWCMMGCGTRLSTARLAARKILRETNGEPDAGFMCPGCEDERFEQKCKEAELAGTEPPTREQVQRQKLEEERVHKKLLDSGYKEWKHDSWPPPGYFTREHYINFNCSKSSSDRHWAKIDFVICPMKGGSFVFLEVDENQHKYGYLNSSKSCDIKRMNSVQHSITMEGTSQGLKAVPSVYWLRYNPMEWKVDGVTNRVLKKTREDRIIAFLERHEPTATAPVTIGYAFYDTTNTALTLLSHSEYPEQFRAITHNLMDMA